MLGYTLPMRGLLLTLLVAGCSEYGLFGKKGDADGDRDAADPAPDEDTDTSGPADSAADSAGDCDGDELPPEALAQDPTCFVVPASTPYTLELVWSRSTFTEVPGSNESMASPIVTSLTDDDGDGDADADDIPDVVLVTNRTEGWHQPIVVRALSGLDGSELWAFADDDVQHAGFPAAADLDDDGFTEVVVPLEGTGLVALSHDGRELWRFDDPFAWSPTSTAPAISDLDGDGTPEIVFGRNVVAADGADFRWGQHGSANISGNYGATAFAVDLDRDGTQEVVAGNTLYDTTGNHLWWQTDEADGHVAAADFDLDGDGEIVVSGSLGDGTAEVRLQDHEGNVLWRYGSTETGTFGPPVVADFDGDLGPEVGVGGQDAFRVLDTDGTELWERPTRDLSSGQTGAVAYDFEGDGVSEIVYADETTLWIFAGPDGTVLARDDRRSSGTQIEAPAIADVDGDGHVDIVVTSMPYELQLETGIFVLTDRTHFGAGRGLWNQYAYHRTNVEDDGAIPAVADLNWDTLNSFRAGDATSMFEGALADLVATVDDVCCVEGALTVWARAGNQGYADAGEATLVLEAETGAGWAEIERRAVGALPAGRLGATEVFTLDGAGVLDVRVRVEGQADECDADNNEGIWGDATCP